MARRKSSVVAEVESSVETSESEETVLQALIDHNAEDHGVQEEGCKSVSISPDASVPTSVDFDQVDAEFNSEHADEDDGLVLLTLVGGDELYVRSDFHGMSKRKQCQYLATTFGMKTAQISKGLGIRYQQVYQALEADASIPKRASLGVCRVCGRPLTDPKHAEEGIGPICSGRHKKGGTINFAEAAQ